MRGGFQPLDARLKVRKGLFESSDTAIEFCVGKLDHRLSFSEAAIHLLLESIDLALHFLFELRNGFGYELNVVTHPLRDNVEVATGFCSDLIGMSTDLCRDLVGMLTDLCSDLVGMLTVPGSDSVGVLTDLCRDLGKMATRLLMSSAAAFFNSFEQAFQLFVRHRFILLRALYAVTAASAIVSVFAAASSVAGMPIGSVIFFSM